MDLSIKSEQNLTKIIEDIQDKLQMVNRSVLQASDFNLADYDDIYDVYKMIMKKPSFSINEIEAIIEELRTFRKTNA